MDLLVMGNQAKHGRYEAGQSGKQTQDFNALWVTASSV